ncbi:hypothetical protein VKS41_002355 [Umbelopsis sp. WA50703]
MTTSDVSSRNKLSPDHNGVHHRKPKPTASSMLDPSSDSVHVRKRDHVSVISDEDRQEMGQSSYSTDSKTVDDQKAQTLSASDVPNFILLVILYLLQGIPVGLSFGSIPFLLKAKMSYSEIAIFSLSSWPYSLKLLWSPIVDAIYWPELGRRKSWIIPIQILTGLLFLALGWHIDAIMAEDNINIYFITTLFLVTIFFCATQDIAVDGWALTLLSKDSLSYASTAQTIGLNTGYFLSFTVFLALNSEEFSNKYLRSPENSSDVGVMPLGTYMIFWSLMYIVVTAWLLIVKTEKPTSTDEDLLGIRGVYTTIWKICKLPHMKSFVVILLVAKIGFICNEGVTALKLLEKGFSKEDLALAALLDFPFQLFFGYYAAKWSTGPNPLRPWLYAFYGRLASAVLGMVVVYFYPEGQDISMTYFCIIMVSTILSSFMSTVQFVSISAFMTSVADPLIGGTYMTLLNTFSNFGGTWPKFFVLEAVDKFTVATCSVLDSDGLEMVCKSEASKLACQKLGGACVIQQDGYYYAGSLCVFLGVSLLVFYVKPAILRIQSIPRHMWRLKAAEDEKSSL